MAIDRRTFGLSLAATAVAGIAPSVSVAREQDSAPSFLTTARDQLSGGYRAVCLDQSLEVLWDAPLQGRAHGPVVHQSQSYAVVIGRRPSMFANVIDLSDGEHVTDIPAAPGRHFYGHGAFEQSGRYLFLTENDFATGQGVIGVYDSRDKFRRIEELPSGGIGPHEIIRLPDGALCVANGGIRTHPDKGRKKLNIETMQPNLQVIDAATGQLGPDLAFDDPRDRKLSIRHAVALDDGRVVVGCQDQTPEATARQLVYVADLYGQTLRPLRMPRGLLPKMRGYVGSVAFDRERGLIAASSPRGGLIALWKADTGAFAGLVPLQDGCGLASNGATGGLIATSGDGSIRRIDEAPLAPKSVRHHFRQWDNHVALI